MLQRSLDRLDFKGIWVGILASILLAFSVGSASALFLTGLDFITIHREKQQDWIWTLPLWGVLIVYAYHRVGSDVQEGNKALVRALKLADYPKISWKMAPWVLLSTWLTHVGGGSAGREGTAVQMGGGLAEQLSQKYPAYRVFFLQAGIAAGFSSIFGTPLAGMFFAYELSGGKSKIQLIWTVLASFGADWVCSHVWGIGHTHYPSWAFMKTQWTLATVGYSVVLAVLIGGMAWFFKWFHRMMKQQVGYITNPYLRVVVGASALVLLFQWDVARPFQGLGVPSIEQAFHQPMPWFYGGLKLILTVFTLAIGFKGGEATPLFFIGAMTGNWLAQGLPIERELAVGLGFVSQFGAVVATPMTAIFMGIELFGQGPLHLVGLVAFGSYWVAGKKGIYEP